MWLRSRRIYPVPYQWRRLLTLAAVAVGLTILGREIGSLPVAIVLSLAYPFVLLPLGFYQPAELKRLRRLVRLGLVSRRLAGAKRREDLGELLVVSESRCASSSSSFAPPP